MQVPILSVLIWLPIAVGAAMPLLERRAGRATLFPAAFAVALTVFLLSLYLYIGFENGTAAMQFVERAAWIPAVGINYHLGVDGISMPLILLTTFTTLLVALHAWNNIARQPAQYFAAFLILEGLMIGVFAALDAILFYVFWEAMLIPMFVIIGIWGGERRIYATIKFFLYTFLGSVFMLVALLYLHLQADSFQILDFHRLPLGQTAQTLIFIAFFLAFAVKIPMWPVHTWLPDAHVEAPTGGSVILAAILLKMGGYGFLRFSLPIAPDASAALVWPMIGLSLVAVVYIGFVALAQQDMKKLIAYSSIAHMGFATLGFFVGFASAAHGTRAHALLGLEGGLMQMISHGFISAALFLCVGIMYERLHSRRIQDYGGVANTMPRFAAYLMLFALANVGLPGTSGFVGEFLVILASFQARLWIAFLAATTLILGAAYTLWMYKRVIFGKVGNARVAALQDIGPREQAMLAAAAAAVLLFGLWPAPLFEVMDPTVRHLLDHVLQGKGG